MAADPDKDDGLDRLLARIALQDRKAFATLYGLTSGKLFAVCLRMLRSKAEAEEALQEVYVKVWRHAGRYDENRSAPMTWLISIARNHAIDILRARRPEETEELATAEEFADPAPGPEAASVLASEGRRIDDCMKQLEEARSQAVRSAYVEGLSYLELAERHGVPVNTMRTWLRRSLLKLRECLDP